MSTFDGRHSPDGEARPGLSSPPAHVMGITIEASAVLLDMDGTLVDSTAVVERVWAEWAGRHGLDPVDVMAIVHGRQTHDSMRVLLPHRSAEETWADSRAMAERETSDVAGVRAIAGAVELLAALAGLPHALVTSATVPLARARMAAAGLPMPAVAVTAEEVSASKPEPEGFLAAAAALEARPADCVVIEDSGAGIAAARAAGMRVLGVGSSARRHAPDWVVPDLRGVGVASRGAAITVTISHLAT